MGREMAKEIQYKQTPCDDDQEKKRKSIKYYYTLQSWQGL